MQVSYNWLSDYCEFDLPPHELAERLSHVGFNVETYEPHGDDWMLDVEVYSNRPDCLSHMGLAREVAAIVGAEARRPELPELPPDGPAFDSVAGVTVEAPDLCPHYTARAITGVKVGPSPDWLQARLTTCGIRPVSNVVDVTNYVLLECGQPLHGFDLALVGGRRIVVRRGAPGETITVIDGTEHELTGDECVIADATHPVAVAGVMGGAESEISDATTDVLIEAARFDPVSVRRTSRAHMLASDSSYRFERSIDPEITDWASRRACQLILELAGGRLANGCADIRADQTQTPDVTLRLSRLNLLLGIRVPRDAVMRTFRGLELNVVAETADAVTVRVPSWRPDLRCEEDLVEEVARVYGYDKLEDGTRMPVRAVTVSRAETAERRLRRLLAGVGFTEVLTQSLTTPTDLQLSQPWTDAPPLALRNPTTAERTHLRLTGMANLLAIARFNQAHGTPEVDLFELGKAYLPRGADEPPRELPILTMLTGRADGLRVLRGALDAVCQALGVQDAVIVEPGARGPFAEGDSLTLRLDGKLLGCAGTVAPEAAEAMDLRNSPALLEVDRGLLIDHCRLSRPVKPVPQYPATRRDLAVVVLEPVRWAELEGCVRAAADETLESVEFLDIYRGDQVPDGHKSVAFSLTFRRSDRTMRADEAESAHAAIVGALESELGARLR